MANVLCLLWFSLAAPRIKAADQNLVVDVGQPLTMTVPYDAYPRAEAEWFKEDEALPTQTMDTTADYTTFRIYEAKTSHRGRYKIILKNKHGKAEAFINVAVIGKCIAPWALFFSEFCFPDDNSHQSHAEWKSTGAVVVRQNLLLSKNKQSLQMGGVMGNLYQNGQNSDTKEIH